MQRIRRAWHEREGWTRRLPTETGYYELWDPRHGVNFIVRVCKTACGKLLVRNPRRPAYGMPLANWKKPCLRMTHWLGPIRVPTHVPERLVENES